MPLIHGKKAVLAALLGGSGLSSVLARRQRGLLLVFNYHRIKPDGAFSTAVDPGVYGPTASEFDRQVAWISRHFHLLSEDALLTTLSRRDPPAEPTAVITFDDGYSDNFTIARPILRRHRASALFFVPARLIEERSLGWWDQIAYALKHARRQEFELAGRRFSLLGGQCTLRELLTWMKKQPEAETRDLVEKLARAADTSLPTAEEQSAELMTWEHLRECTKSGIAVGSHGHTHRVLSTLSPEDQRVELSESKDLITRRIGEIVRTVAFPVGGRGHFTAVTKSLAENLGYQAAFSFQGPRAVNRWGAIDLFDIRRLAAPNSASLIAALAAAPNLMASR